MKLRVRSKRKSARIEIIPLIDIMFFLLATFVMVSTAMINNRGIAVSLPAADTGSKEHRKDYISLTVTESGDYYIDKQKIESKDLSAQLLAIKNQNPDPKVFINGDRNANVGSLVNALDLVRKAGISKVALETALK